MDERRATGRTTRLIEEAIRLADEGRFVVVVVNTHSEASHITARHPRIRAVVPEQVDWYTMRIPGVSPDTPILVDHYVIERRFSHMLQALHQFDHDK